MAPSGFGPYHGMAGGGWGRLGAAGGKGGGQRRRRRRGDFGLNTGIFSPKLYFLVRAGGELQARCVVAVEG